MTDSQKEDIISRLKNRIGQLECPMCHNHNFVLADGYVINILQDDPFGKIKMSGKGIPKIAIVCDNCGFLSSHAIGILGIVPETNEDKTDEKEAESPKV